MQVGRFGYYLPWSLAGGMVSSVGNGLLTTFTPSTSVGKWIGYQILLGAGRGAGLQMVRRLSSQFLMPMANG